MTSRQTAFSIPDGSAAAPALAEPPTPASMGRLERDLGRVRCDDLRGPATEDPGTIEFESWLAQLH